MNPESDDMNRSAASGLALAESALQVAKDEYASLDVQAYLDRIVVLAQNALSRLPEGPRVGVGDMIHALNTYLFDEEGFYHNRHDPWDPRNSFLNDVLDSKFGDPVTLSVIYISVGRRLGLPLKGLALPGHFLVKFPAGSGDLFIDPFAGGTPVGAEELQFILSTGSGAGSWSKASIEAFTRGTDDRRILLRLLQDLKKRHIKAGQHHKALAAVERILRLAPEETSELRERGRLWELLGCPGPAADDYRAYLARRPRASDAERLHRKIAFLGSRKLTFH